jgi:hypothetical protein
VLKIAGKAEPIVNEAPGFVILSEAKNLSFLCRCLHLDRREILRFAQNDNGFWLLPRIFYSHGKKIEDPMIERNSRRESRAQSRPHSLLTKRRDRNNFIAI